ncbi:MAG: redoxin domain-containing protein [Phycisphaeraceae bacterium]|nr:redoxin domain-containing protein [Phycisphaeraceae bacterium]
MGWMSGRRAWTAAVAVAWAWAAVGQATGPSAGAVNEAEEKGRAVLRGAVEYLSAAKSLEVQVRCRHETSKRGVGQWYETVYDAAVERPGKFSLKPTQNPRGLGTVACDGQKVTAYLPPLRGYVERAVGEEGRVKEVEKDEDLQLAMGPAADWMTVMIEPGVGMQWLKGAQGVAWVGDESVDGRACDHVRVGVGAGENEEAEVVDLWIARGDRPLVVRGMRTTTQGNYYSQANMTTVVDTATFEDWRVDEAVGAEVFAYTPPEWVEKIEKLADRMVRPMSPAGQLVGREAPTFTAKTLDGKVVDLAALRGKQVVVLDFWATWCGPCVESLPELQRVAEGYADRPVTVLAVNDGEDAATIRAFLEKKGLKLTVVMDEQGQIVRLYGVSAIPRTVVIGMDGKVVLDATGYSAGYAQEIREAVDKALAASPPEAAPGGAGATTGPAPRAPR